ncbi:GDSL-type esterase/lipase family protein, partial [Nocardia salmonicida]|uniref:GDSL-type esterase/lipase family protein n=1 Tax=Nocardia salmonicida TaxID=53431 RepID=UPI0033C95202
VGGCSTLRDEDPDGSPCRDSVTKGGSDELLARVDRAEEEIVEVLEEIERRGPDARVLVVGYPAIFPEQGSCPDRLPLADGDTTYAAEVMAAMVAAQRSAAERAGVEFVDVYAATRGHDICAEDPWIQDKENDRRKAMAFHPFAKEQEVVAGLIVTMLREAASPQPEVT